MSNLDLAQAYKETLYVVNIADKKSITLRIEQINKEFDQILGEHQINSWAFITAFNQYSKIEPDDII